MRMHFPDMMASMDIAKEVKRLGRGRPDRIRPPQAPVAHVPSSIRNLAGEPRSRRSTRRKRFTKRATSTRPARRSGRRSAQTDKHPLHARVYYGLARIAALQREPRIGGTTVS